jgi:hypothetical protein
MGSPSKIKLNFEKFPLTSAVIILFFVQLQMLPGSSYQNNGGFPMLPWLTVPQRWSGAPLREYSIRPAEFCSGMSKSIFFLFDDQYFWFRLRIVKERKGRLSGFLTDHFIH